MKVLIWGAYSCMSRYILWTVDGEAYAQGAKKDSISDEGAYYIHTYIYRAANFCIYKVRMYLSIC